MSVNKSTVSFVLSILTFIAVISLCFLFFFNGKKTAFIKTADVFSEFKMKKVLETEFKKVENMRKVQLDSMVLVLKMINRDADTKEKKDFLEYKKEEFQTKRDEYAEANEALTQKYNEQIWNQLNQYIKDYGDKAGFEYIYGANGDGTLMYAADKKDITKEIIKYANEKYEGVQ